MSLSTSTRSLEEMTATRDMLRTELAALDQQAAILTQELERARLDQNRIRHLLTALEAAIAETGLPGR